MSVRRNIKNVVYNYSEAARKAREATSNDPWGPSTTLMQEIADLTYNMVAYSDIMPILWKRLNDHGKNWRHVYKSLVLLDYLVRYGSKRITQQCKENIFVIQTLKDFQYIEGNKDQGLNVREKAKQLVALLKDDERLKNERAKAEALRQRLNQDYALTGGGGGGTPVSHSELDKRMRRFGNYHRHPSYFSTSFPAYDGLTHRVQPPIDPNVAKEYAAPDNPEEEAMQVQLALAISKQEAEEEERRRKSDHIKLSMAMSESLKNEQGVLDQPSNTIQNSGKHASENDLFGIFDGWSNNRAPTDNDAVLINRPVSANPWISQPCSSNRNRTDDVWGVPSIPWTPLPTGSPVDDIWGTGNQEVANVPAGAATANPQFARDPDKIVNVAKELNDFFTQSTAATSAAPPPAIANSFDYYNLTGASPNPVAPAAGVAHAADKGPAAEFKGPEAFLGEHQSLVDLNNLASTQKPSSWDYYNVSGTLGQGGVDSAAAAAAVPQPAIGSRPPGIAFTTTTGPVDVAPQTNPFALSSMTAAKPAFNPFASASGRAPTLNELSSISSSSKEIGQGDAAAGAGSVLPPPLVPLSTAPSKSPVAGTQPAQATSSSYNPFR